MAHSTIVLLPLITDQKEKDGWGCCASIGFAVGYGTCVKAMEVNPRQGLDCALSLRYCAEFASDTSRRAAITTCLKKNRKKRGHVSASHSRTDKHRKHLGGCSKSLHMWHL